MERIAKTQNGNSFDVRVRPINVQRDESASTSTGIAGSDWGVWACSERNDVGFFMLITITISSFYETHRSKV